MSKTLVIWNPIAGNGASAKLWPLIEPALREGGWVFDVARTQAPLHAIRLAEQAKRDGYETIIAVGGDGIIHEVVNGLMRATNEEPNCKLGVIPVGSGNDFSKMVNLRALDWQTAVQRIFAGNTVWFDVGKVIGDKPAVGLEAGAYYFVNSFDTGFGAQVSKHTHIKFLTGTAMYMVAILKTLIDYQVPRLHIEFADGKIIDQTSTITAVMIGRCFGSGFWIAPTAHVDDGLFDVYIADGLGRIGILGLLPRVMKGTHVGDPRIKNFQTPRLVITSPDPLAVETDGELPYLDAHRLEIEILPKRIKVIA
jgi:diacylglycerol kinase (ATP)